MKKSIVVLGGAIALIFMAFAANAGNKIHPNSKALFAGLESSGIIADSSLPWEKKYRAYDVLCHSTPQGNTTCTMWDLPQNATGAKEWALSGVVAEKMRMSMHTLKVSQGDSGAFTDYLTCTRNTKNKFREYSCYASQAVECDDILSCDM